jgi:hypothetical protein
VKEWARFERDSAKERKYSKNALVAIAGLFENLACFVAVME